MASEPVLDGSGEGLAPSAAGAASPPADSGGGGGVEEEKGESASERNGADGGNDNSNNGDGDDDNDGSNPPPPPAAGGAAAAASAASSASPGMSVTPMAVDPPSTPGAPSRTAATGGASSPTASTLLSTTAKVRAGYDTVHCWPLFGRRAFGGSCLVVGPRVAWGRAFDPPPCWWLSDGRSYAIFDRNHAALLSFFLLRLPPAPAAALFLSLLPIHLLDQ